MSLRRVPRCNFGTQNSLNSFYDLVIVGGGLVGSAMACTIGKNSLLGAKNVLLLDSGKIMQKVENSTNQYSNRVSAISPSSVRFFKRFGIWDNIKSRAQAVSTLYVEDGQSGTKISFEELGSHSPVAFIVENHIILQELQGCLQTSCPNVEWRRESTFDKISIPENLAQNVSLQLNDGQKTECSLLIAADGANSKVREISGIGHNVKDYDQMAIVATLELTPSGIAQNTTAWQRFMPNGPVAILPLKNHLSSLVWTTSTEEAKRLLGISSHLFVEELNSALTSEMHIKPNSCLKVANYVFNSLPFLKDVPKLNFPTINSLPYDDRAAFPLSFIRVEDYIRHRVSLIGDAAHRIHPLAGQGVNLGWSDVNNLTKTLELACKRGEDLGSLACLKEYDNRSQQRNVPMMTAIDSLNHMFTSNSAPVVFLRSAGFSLLDRMLPVKDLIVRFSS